MVSVIIPVYNVEKYLTCCLESVLAQTYTDYEMILIDDGSTDQSGKICDEYAENNEKIKVIHQKNAGLASARNTGIRVAKGEYIYFIDSDDCIHPELLMTTVTIADKVNANIVQIELQSVPENFADYKSVELKNVKLQRFTLTEAIMNLDKDDKTISSDIRLTTTVVWTKLYRVSAFSNIQFPEGMRMHEDQMVAHRFIEQAGGMVFLNQPMYYYRQSASSLIRVGWTEKRLAILDCYEDRFQCVCNLDVPIEEKRNLINYMYYRYLVCLLRNYVMINDKMSGERQRYWKKRILKKTKELYFSKQGELSLNHFLIFGLFLSCPKLVTVGFKIRSKMRK